MRGPVEYGKELILDLHQCACGKLNRKDIEAFMVKLCQLIDMQRGELYFWDYEGESKEYANAPPHLKGSSAVQFITTSNITIHILDDLRHVYLNIFSCKSFDENKVIPFVLGWFGGQVVQSALLKRL